MTLWLLTLVLSCGAWSSDGDFEKALAEGHGRIRLVHHDYESRKGSERIARSVYGSLSLPELADLLCQRPAHDPLGTFIYENVVRYQLERATAQTANERDQQGVTALIHVARRLSEQNRYDAKGACERLGSYLITLLSQAPKQLDAADAAGNTALHYAARSEATAELYSALVLKGASNEAKNKAGQAPESLLLPQTRAAVAESVARGQDQIKHCAGLETKLKACGREWRCTEALEREIRNSCRSPEEDWRRRY